MFVGLKASATQGQTGCGICGGGSCDQAISETAVLAAPLGELDPDEPVLLAAAAASFRSLV
jgi:hypothetical protein